MKPFQLIITHPDKKTWMENFDTKRELNAWLKGEQSKSYWQKESTVEIIDRTKQIEEQERIAKELDEQNRARRDKIRELLTEFKGKEKLTVAECGEAIKNLMDFIGFE